MLKDWRKEYVNIKFPVCESESDEGQANNLIEINKPKHGKLYNYRRGTEQDLENLKNKLVWCSRADSFNDPYDSALFVRSEELLHIVGNQEGELEQLKKEIDEMSPIKKYLDIDSMLAVLGRKADSIIQPVLDTLRNSIAIYCLTEEKDSILMWSHYGDNHKGFCIEYDFDEIRENFEQFHPVVYDEEFCNISEYIMESNPNSVFRAVISKAYEWKYEKEWRAILVNNSKSSGHTITSPKIKGIYLGCKADEVLERKIKDIIKDGNIPLYKMYIMKNRFKILERRI